jgi:hypothetical protein
MGRSANNLLIAEWRADPAKIIREDLVNPETGNHSNCIPPRLNFCAALLPLVLTGRLKYLEFVYSCAKKSGKTGFAAMIATYRAAVLGGPYAKIWCLANDCKQSQGPVFQAAARIVQASPLLRGSAKVTQDCALFSGTGSFIAAAASDAAGFAGSNPSLTIFDELWAYASARSRRLFDESTPSPTRKIFGRLVVSYAGSWARASFSRPSTNAGSPGPRLPRTCSNPRRRFAFGRTTVRRLGRIPAGINE